MSWESQSHLWIELHRLVEAYARTVGTPYSTIFAELEARFAFTRAERSRWPDLETMRAAATLLADRRDAVLRQRRAWIEARRRTKARRRAGVPGAMDPPPPGLLEHEARCRAYAATVPAVGFWGWEKRRQREGSA